MAVGGDLALPEVAGHRPLTLRITNAYGERLLRAVTETRRLDEMARRPIMAWERSKAEDGTREAASRGRDPDGGVPLPRRPLRIVTGASFSVRGAEVLVADGQPKRSLQDLEALALERLLS